MAVDEECLVSSVAAHAGGLALDDARRVTETVLSAIGALLIRGDRWLVADELPASLAAALVGMRIGRALSVERLVERPGVSAARAHELVASVCRALAATLSDASVGRLRQRLPESVARLVVVPMPAKSVEHGLRSA